MRVLQINKFFFEKGGAERYFFSLSRALEQRGHRVNHFSMHHPDNLPSPDQRYFVSRKNLAERPSPREALAAGFSFIRSGEAARNLKRLIDEQKPDVAHLHNIYHQLTPSILPVLAAAGVPAVMTVHDSKLVCPNYSLFDGRRYCYRCRGGRFFHAPLARCSGGSVLRGALLAAEAYYQRLTRVYDRLAFFIAPSRFMRSLLVAEGFGEGRVVFVPAFIAEPDREGTPAALSLPSRYVLYFGRLSREKGLRTLLEAMRRLDRVHLVVSGAGPLRGEMDRFVSEHGMGNITFTGHLDYSTLRGIVARARAVTLPAILPENAPFAVLEAMAAGVPVVVSNMGGLPELAERGGGMIVEPGDAEALAGAIAALWRDDAAARDLGERGRRAIEQDFDYDTHMQALEGIYQRAIDR